MKRVKNENSIRLNWMITELRSVLSSLIKSLYMALIRKNSVMAYKTVSRPYMVINNQLMKLLYAFDWPV